MFFEKGDHIVQRLIDAVVGKPFAEEQLVNLHGEELGLGAQIVILDVIKVRCLHGAADTAEICAGGKTEALSKNIKEKRLFVALCQLIFQLGVLLPVFGEITDIICIEQMHDRDQIGQTSLSVALIFKRPESGGTKLADKVRHDEAQIIGERAPNVYSMSITFK